MAKVNNKGYKRKLSSTSLYNACTLGTINLDIMVVPEYTTVIYILPLKNIPPHVWISLNIIIIFVTFSLLPKQLSNINKQFNRQQNKLARL